MACNLLLHLFKAANSSRKNHIIKEENPLDTNTSFDDGASKKDQDT
jgi:hypothetical protein